MVLRNNLSYHPVVGSESKRFLQLGQLHYLDFGESDLTERIRPGYANDELTHSES